MNRIRHLQKVRLGLADDPHRHRPGPVVAQHAALVLGPQFHRAQVAQLHQLATLVRHRQVPELLRGLELAQRPDRELPAVALDPPGRDLDIAGLDGRLDVLYRDPARDQLVGIEPDAHRIAPLAVDGCLAHTREALELGLDDPLPDVRQLQQRNVLALERHEHEGLGVGLLLGDDRLLDVLRQPSPHPRDPVAHILRGVIDVAVERELDGDVAELLGAGAGERPDARNGAQFLLENVGDRGLHHLGIGPRQESAHRNNGRIDIRELPDRQLAVTDHAEEDERQAHHAGEDRPLDRYVR